MINKRLRRSSLGLLLLAYLVASGLLRSKHAVLFVDTKASRIPQHSTQNIEVYSIAVAAVLTATWVPERVENAKRICNLAEDALGVRCHVVKATKLDEDSDALDEIRVKGYFKHFQNYFTTKTNAAETYVAHVLKMLLHPRVAYAHIISDGPKGRLYEMDGERVSQIKLGSIGNLGLFGILADFVSQEISDGRNRQPSYTLWRNVSAAITMGEETEVLHANTVRKKAIMMFEDDAALVASSPSLFASDMRTLLATLPPNWDLLDLDPHPDFCDGYLWRQPKRRVVSDLSMPSSSSSSSSVKVYQTYTTFSRTAATVVSWNGAMKLLRRLPADVVVDMFIAKIMRQGALNVYVACDNTIIRQKDSTMVSVRG